MTSTHYEQGGWLEEYTSGPTQQEVRTQRSLAIRATVGLLAVIVGLGGVHEGRAFLQHKLEHHTSTDATTQQP